MSLSFRSPILWSLPRYATQRFKYHLSLDANLFPSSLEER